MTPMIEYRTVDKSQWPDGPWKNEPDKIQWTDRKTGLPCLIKRNPRLGILCGYVGVAEGHRFYRVDYGEVDIEDEPHGGLTYAALCEDGPEDQAICHVPGEGDSDHVWWFGFDCAHGCDHCPTRSEQLFDRVSYRTINYVKAQCAALARQLA